MTEVTGICKDKIYHFEVSVKKLTNFDLLKEAASTTSGKVFKNEDWCSWYRSEHSPIRTQEFWVSLIGIPHFVHVCYVRHHVGNQHYVSTGREDRGADPDQTRWSPVNMTFKTNAQSLINMSRSRICNKSHEVVRKVHQAIREEVRLLDPFLARYMVRECVYRCGFCKEFRPCGFLETPEAISEILSYVGEIDCKGRVLQVKIV